MPGDYSQDRDSAHIRQSFFESGASLAYLQAQMGHSSIQTTVDVYGHMVPGANRHEVDKLDAILAENAPYTHQRFN